MGSGIPEKEGPSGEGSVEMDSDDVPCTSPFFQDACPPQSPDLPPFLEDLPSGRGLSAFPTGPS